jgi:hypothetical protein
MSTKITPFLLGLPVEIVYRILDHLEIQTILLSCRNVCTRLNTIIDTYHRYQVNFIFISFTACRICSIIPNHIYVFNIYLTLLNRHSPCWIFPPRISMVRNCNAYVMHYKTILWDVYISYSFLLLLSYTDNNWT